MEIFNFSHAAEYLNSTQENHRSIETEYLPAILEAFRAFLHECGFTYIETIDADCGDNLWSSEDA